ncbi:MAG TPA: sporulation protein YabP [Candidatus Ventricola intestinavium]|nr:sporulation protein YabP [Candidatus Ventricola intestinavium]
MEKDMTQSKAPFRKHSLVLEGRARAKLAGVTAVSCFNDQEVVLETSEGEVALLGEGLHIEQLNLEDGQLDVTGSISAVEYSDLSPRKERRGLFSRRRK